IGAGDDLGCNRAAGTGAIVDHHLPQAHRDLLRNKTGHIVGRSPRRERHDQLDRLVRVGLRGSFAASGQADAGGDDRRQQIPTGDHVVSGNDHSILILAALATSVHFRVSAARNAAKSRGEAGRTSAPSLANAAATSGAVRLSLIAALSRLMIAAGVAAGATTPI